MAFAHGCKKGTRMRTQMRMATRRKRLLVWSPMMELVENELTASIRGCFYDVQNQVGLGLPEEAYQQGLIAALAARGIPALSKGEVWLEYRGRRIVKFLPDFQIAANVVLELK